MLPEPSLLHLNITRLSRWQLIQQMMQSFWARWHREYLTTLNSRQKHHSANCNFEEGRLVLIRDETSPASRWPLARIQYVHPGRDNLTRVVTLRTANGNQIKRPITKICPLPKIDSCESRGPKCSTQS